MTMSNTPNDPTEALGQIETAAEQAKEQIEAERQQAQQAARSDAERQMIDARFNEMQISVDNKVATAIEAIKSDFGSRFDNLESLVRDLGSRGNAGDTIEDDGILSIEEITDELGSGFEAGAQAVESAAESAATEIDEAPARVHGLFKRWWG